jgi:misacylated tRNA(Ala) deacylase
MSRYFCHEHPEVLILETRVVDTRPGAVVLEQSPFHPGGGGQLADRGLLRWKGGELRVTGIEAVDGRHWHLLAEPVEIAGLVETVVDPTFRSTMSQLHTDTHILNALVFQHFQGALVTGAQLNEDGTARMDFDLPAADNDRLRALEPEINDVIRQDLPVRYAYVPEAEALAGRGLVRNRSVAPPPAADGTIRLVEIVGLDRQACGGTHLSSTAASRPVRILKIDNKGRHNRRVRIGLAEAGPG